MGDTYARILDGLEQRARKTGVAPRLLAMLGMLEAEAGAAYDPVFINKPELLPVLEPITLKDMCAMLGRDAAEAAAVNCVDADAWLMPGSFISLPAQV